MEDSTVSLGPQGQRRKSSLVRIILHLISFIYSSAHAIISFVLLFIATYFFSYSVISNPLSGNDALNNLNYILFYDKYFPHIPLWNPQMGGGVSSTFGYPQLYTFFVIILHRISHLTIISSMGIANFLSILLPSWGVYLFVALRLKSKTGGLIAGFLFLFSPLIYVWNIGAGFLSQVFSVIFVAPFLICFDWFLDSCLKKDKLNLLALFLIGIIGTLALLAHPATYMGLVGFTFLYIIGRVMLDYFKQIKNKIIPGMKAFFFANVVVFGLSAFWLIPLQIYTAFANRDMSQNVDPSVWAQLSVSGVMGILSPTGGYPYPNYSIYPPIWILTIAAIILGLLIDRKTAILGILSVLSIFFVGSISAFIFLSKINFFISSIFSLRPWYPLTAILNPIAAAMTGILVGKLFVSPLSLVIKKSKIKLLSRFIKVINFFLVPIIAIITVYFALYLLNPIAGYYNKNKPYLIPIGLIDKSSLNKNEIWFRIRDKECFDRGLNCNKLYLDYVNPNTFFIQQCNNYPKDQRVLEIDSICKGEKIIASGENKGKSLSIEKADIEAFFTKHCDERNKTGPFFYPEYSLCLALGKNFWSQINRWPVASLYYGNDDLEKIVEPIALSSEGEKVVKDQNSRVDVSPQLGSLIKNWNILYPSSTLGVYTGQIGLIKSYYSIFVLSMYESKSVEPETINMLGNYYGTQALVVNPSTSPIDSFKKAGWEEFYKGSNVLRPPFVTGMASLSTKPRILVIGSRKLEVYKQIFKNAVSGIIPYDDGILIKGPERLGDLSLKELSKYNLVILVGYKYKSRSSDLKMLKEYVSNGGLVFIDSGWQYASDDWGIEKDGDSFATEFPEPLPINKTKWIKIGKSWDKGKLDKDFAKDVNVQNFGPLEWAGQDWSVASAENVRDSAKPILTNGESVLIAGGSYGKGKIIWSGMNIFNHILEYKSKDEMNLLKNIFKYLKDDSIEVKDIPVEFNFETPGKAVFRINNPVLANASLYFRQAYYPSWSAYYLKNGNKSKLEVKVAGPEFMLVNLSNIEPGDSVVFEFEKPKYLIFGIVVSTVTLLIFILAFFDKAFFKGKTFKLLNNLLKERVILKLARPFKNIRLKSITGKSNEEESY